MTNPIAIALGLLIVGMFGLDFMVNGGVGSLFLAKKFMTFTEWLAFWR